MPLTSTVHLFTFWRLNHCSSFMIFPLRSYTSSVPSYMPLDSWNAFTESEAVETGSVTCSSFLFPTRFNIIMCSSLIQMHCMGVRKIILSMIIIYNLPSILQIFSSIVPILLMRKLRLRVIKCWPKSHGQVENQNWNTGGSHSRAQVLNQLRTLFMVLSQWVCLNQGVLTYTSILST